MAYLADKRQALARRLLWPDGNGGRAGFRCWAAGWCLDPKAYGELRLAALTFYMINS